MTSRSAGPAVSTAGAVTRSSVSETTSKLADAPATFTVWAPESADPWTVNTSPPAVEAVEGLTDASRGARLPADAVWNASRYGRSIPPPR